MERAYDNAVVLRDELSSRTLSYIQLALDCMEKHAGSGAFAYDLQPVLDDLFAFWAAWMTMWRMRNAAISSSAANIWNAWICICGWIIHTV